MFGTLDGDAEIILGPTPRSSAVLFTVSAKTYLNSNVKVSLFVVPYITTALNSVVAVIDVDAAAAFTCPALVPSDATRYISYVESESAELTTYVPAGNGLESDVFVYPDDPVVTVKSFDNPLDDPPDKLP
jgi:hypothetical protein